MCTPSHVAEVSLPVYSEACEALPVLLHPSLPVLKVLNCTHKRHPLFRRVSFEDFYNSLAFFELDPEKELYEEGKRAEGWYVLKSGSVELRTKRESTDREIVEMGTWFGEQGLAYGTERLESAIARDYVCFWRMTRGSYCAFIEKIRMEMAPSIDETLHRSLLFSEVPKEQFPSLVPYVIPLEFPCATPIVTQGEPGDCFFLIQTGEVAVTENERPKRCLRDWDFFGEQALLYGLLRTASVNASSPSGVKCLCLHQSVLEGNVGKSIYQAIFRNTQRIALDRSSYLGHLSEEVKDRLILSMQIFTYEESETVIKAGSKRGFYLWIVLFGSLKSRNQVFLPWNCLGDDQILGVPEGFYEEDVQANYHEVALACIGRNVFEECLGITSSRALEGIPGSITHEIRLFQGMKSMDIAKLCATIGLVKYTKNEVIMTEHQSSERLFIVKSGSVALYKSELLVRIPMKWDFFGEFNIAQDRSKWVTAVSTAEVTECWVLARDSFYQVFPQEALKVLYRNWLKAYDIGSLADLVPVCCLTNSAFASITLAVSANSDTYALKSLSKAKIQTQSLEKAVLMERNVLLRLQHPLIPRLFKTFQDSGYIYFLSQFTAGECLFDVMTERGVFTLSETRFLAGAMVLIIDHLHERQVLHRDLKPEHFLLSPCGYLYLTDLSSAKYCEKTNSVTGTPQFMAPEVIMGKMYGAAVDLWSLGVIWYEFLTGGLPFAQADDDPYSICQQILTETVHFPSSLPETAVNLLKKLLSRVPADRGTSQDLKFHSFFLNFPFVSSTQDDILDQTAVSPLANRGKDFSQSIAAARRNPASWRSVLERNLALEDLEGDWLPFRTQRSSLLWNWDREF